MSDQMTARTLSDSEQVAIVQGGGRIKAEHSLFNDRDPLPPCAVHRYWRVITCDYPNRDVVECRDCGAQRTAACDFDEEYD